MFRTRIFCLVLAVCCFFGIIGTANAAEVDSDSVYCFSLEDFSGETSVSGICITDLPEGPGALMLGSRMLAEGDVLTAEQVARMTFLPDRSEWDKTVEVGYLPIYEGYVDDHAVMTLSIRGKEDKAPVAEDSAMETYKNLENTGKLKVTDPEGEAMTFAIVRQPKRGTVTIGEDGSFTYTPKKNKVGIDSFVYTATDAAGKTSREATVTITILKPSDATQYTDTLGKECRFAAEWMRHTGIFVGESLAEEPCFGPEKEVTRGEFVTMLVKTLEIPVEEEVVYTGFADEIPQWLQPYLAAAMRSGLTAGLSDPQVFDAGEVITDMEAAALVGCALDLTAEEVFAGTGDEAMTRSDAADLLYRAAKLAEGQKIDEIV